VAAHTLTAWEEWPETPPKSTTGGRVFVTRYRLCTHDPAFEHI